MTGLGLLPVGDAQWAAAVMAREIAAEAAHRPELDPETVRALVEHLQRISVGEDLPHALRAELLPPA